MRKAAIGLVLLALAGCGSTEPQPAPTNQSLGSALKEVAQPHDPLAPASNASRPEATSGGTAVQ